MAYGAAPAQPQPEGRLAYKWKVLISVIFGIFMIILDTTVVNVAFQTIRREYNTSLNNAQWIISIYTLALGIATPLSGFLADRFGIKRMYVGGLAAFVFGSLLCGLAPTISSSIWLLVAARAVQGFGGGIAQPLGSALLFSTFPPKEQGTALGIFGIALVVAPALGPIMGGLLVDQGVWRWIFFINIPIGIVGVFLASRFLRERRPERIPALDPLGLVTAVVGFGSVLYAASVAADQGWGAANVLLWFAVGGVSLVAFAIVELFVAKEPLLNLRLFGNSTFLTASLIGYVTVIGLFGAEFLLPVYLQALRGRTALQTGFILLPLALTSGVITPLAGRLYDRIGPRMLITTGFALLAINTWQLSKIQADTPIATLLMLLALRGAALGLTVQTTFATALAAVPRQALARGSSLINGTRFVVQSLGVAILATVLASALSPAVKAQSRQFQEQAGQRAASAPFGLCETPGVPADQNVPPGVPAVARAQALAGVQQACRENLVGFERTYLLTFYVALAAVVIGLFMPGWPFRWAGRGAAGEAPPTPAAH
ncbi:MAG TPA: DHA2 family efflux MFS transporter permease subunit [Kouleothrix sp.]|uniref:DHA2 family efflux MFS transporter permease subunit n=1 Tax=Kouleothrix sp. TaxID=2779161 RepID=UPI002BC16E36|nr:DHA2 family efflux MFS transporter permease subunit [Kouleothrix sp.]HRC75703.1 DHA2 family efflux MFS transporter permease subunit [Kouleothrix sp.]